jgi:hypothetical protein
MSLLCSRLLCTASNEQTNDLTTMSSISASNREHESASSVQEEPYVGTIQVQQVSVDELEPSRQTNNSLPVDEMNQYDDDDDLTVIVLEQGAENAFINQAAAAGWVGQDSPEMEERRRNVLLRELQIVQRTSFIHFMVLCLIPTSLLLIVIATVFGEDEECESLATACVREARTFINAFTSRCVCDAIIVVQELP